MDRRVDNALAAAGLAADVQTPVSRESWGPRWGARREPVSRGAMALGACAPCWPVQTLPSATSLSVLARFNWDRLVWEDPHPAPTPPPTPTAPGRPLHASAAYRFEGGPRGPTRWRRSWPSEDTGAARMGHVWSGVLPGPTGTLVSSAAPRAAVGRSPLVVQG